MLIKFICCDVFARIACDLVAKSPHVIDVEFVPMLAHVEPDNLRQLIQEKIDNMESSGRNYEALILGFGLCGNSVIGLSCCVPMVIPRAHDCCTLHMGSKERFIEVFGKNPSMRWGSTGYFERTMIAGSGYYIYDQLQNYKTSVEYMGYLEQYDEETAEYLWSTMHPPIESNESIYIEIDGFEYSDAQEQYRSAMENLGVTQTTVEGNVSMLRALCNGEWDDERFLTITPGKKIAGVYDLDIVMKEEE